MYAVKSNCQTVSTSLELIYILKRQLWSSYTLENVVAFKRRNIFIKQLRFEEDPNRKEMDNLYHHH